MRGGWSGRGSLEKRLKAITSPRAKRLLGAALREAGETIATYAQTSITRGAVSGKGHVPSKPGEAPRADTHRLADLIEVTQPDPLEVIISSNAPYGAAQEFGADIANAFGNGTAVTLPARPFMRPARDAKKKEARKKFAEAVDHIVRGGAG